MAQSAERRRVLDRSYILRCGNMCQGLLGIAVAGDNPEDSMTLLKGIVMIGRASALLFFFLLAARACSGPVELKYRATGSSPELLAVYEGWFGEHNHISVGYTSHDPDAMRRQIDGAKAMGLTAFVVDWYGDRDAYIDQSYARLQKLAAKENFHIAMMYEAPGQEDGATDEAIADLTMFHDTYMAANSRGSEAYLTYDGRPLIFVFPHGHATDWDKVRQVVNQWNPAPLLIDENLPGQNAKDFDGFYPWINPGPQGWANDGSHWGEQYLSNFYQTMGTQYPDKLIVGGAWAEFDDSKASWGLNRHISARCGQTLEDTFNFWKKIYPAGQTIPFVLIETWNDYEEGSAIEPGLPSCGGQAPTSLVESAAGQQPGRAGAQ